MRRLAALALVLVACGGGKSNAKSAGAADVVVSDVDGGTVVGGAMPDPRKLNNTSKSERRPLTHAECRAFTMHARDIYAREVNVDPTTLDGLMERQFGVCETPYFSDEVFDCLIAAKNLDEFQACMPLGAF